MDKPVTASQLYTRIYSIVETIPKGYVASYGVVAKKAGLMRGARVVGWALRSLPNPDAIPWHRVVNQKGIISIENRRIPAELQKNLLQKEGIQFEGDSFQILTPRWFE